ncbi:MAG: AAA family ATPase [Patescibacteria group bacterium]|nr:AAA family ATPase [Patescibacteria group bacterium]
MFKQIEIKNFRGIKELKVENLKKFNVFVGDNGSGKTSILDAVYISINPNNPNLSPKTNVFRGISETPEKLERFWKSLFYDFNSSSNISINCLLAGNEKRNLQIKPMFEFQEGEYLKSPDKVSSDSKMKKNILGLNIDFDINGEKFKSETKQQEQVRADEKYKELLTGAYLNSFTVQDRSGISKDLSDVLEMKKKSKVIEFLKKFKESISDIYSDEKRISILDDDFDESVLLNTYGDGLVRGLRYYLTALNNNNIILIDEIENGLHWSKQMVVFEYLYKISEEFKDVQFFMTSHSYDTVNSLYKTAKEFDFMNDVNICRVESADGKSRIEYFNENDLKYFSDNKLELR